LDRKLEGRAGAAGSSPGRVVTKRKPAMVEAVARTPVPWGTFTGWSVRLVKTTAPDAAGWAGGRNRWRAG